VDDILKLSGAGFLKKPMKPFIAVPTTAGTGSEVTNVAVVADTERNTKIPFLSYHLFPNTAILDPRMTLTLPPHITAATAMDALCHAVEATVCLQKNPLSDAHAFAAIKLISENLLHVIQNPDDSQGRLALANAACLAGAAFSNSMVGMIHALGHALGGVCHVPHGVAMNIFLPHGLEYNMNKSADQIAELLLPLAGAEVYARVSKNRRAERVVEAIRDLQNKLNVQTRLPLTLKEAGVDAGALEAVAKTAINDPALTFNPEEMDFNDAMAVLKKAYN
jgi:alcohol dehydrogenase